MQIFFKPALAIALLSFVSNSVLANSAEETMLPEEYKIYFKDKATNKPFKGASEKILPTINDFKGAPGCYVACYSHKSDNSVYLVGSHVYMMGQIRVPGQYKGRICKPTGFEKADLSESKEFKDKCDKHLPKACHESSCWAGGDTGGWFGIQK